MNITVNSQILVQDLRLLNKIAPSKHSLPILSHLLVTATDTLTFYATDLEIGVRTPCTALRIDEPGTIALPVARLLALVEQFPSADVHLVTDGAHVRVTCGAFKARLQALSAADFPVLPTLEGEAYTLDGPAMQTLIARTRYAIAEGTDKYYLQGALLTLTDGLMALVATDGKRLALATAPYTGSTGSIILPTKLLDLIRTQPEGAVLTLTIGPRHSIVTVNGRWLIARQIDGTFPNYERFIPRDHPLSAQVDRAALAAALRRVGLAAGATHATRLHLQAGSVEIAASSAEIGDSTEAVPLVYEGEPVSTVVDWRSVVDLLAVAESPTMEIRFKDGLKPLLFLDGPSHLAVVLTMR